MTEGTAKSPKDPMGTRTLLGTKERNDRARGGSDISQGQSGIMLRGIPGELEIQSIAAHLHVTLKH